MLSFFPELLYLGPFAGFLIRLALAALFFISASRRVRATPVILKIFGAVDGVIALALIVGFATQLASLAAFVCLTYWFFKRDVSPFPRSTVALAGAMSLSLLILGPGPFAFDLPL